MSMQTLPTLSLESGLNRYMEEIKKFPVLSQQDEYDLAIKWYEQQDLSAAHKLVTSHLKLVAKIAMQFKGYGLPLIDVISEGNIGLMTAVKKFNPYLGYRLSTYAMWWIKANIQDFILKSWPAIKIGTSSAQKKLFFNLKKIKNKLLHLNNGNVLANESELIAKELDVSKRDVEEMSDRLSNYNDSLNDVAYDDSEVEKMAQIMEPSDNQEISLIKTNEYNYQKNKFLNAFNLLNAREQRIIEARRLSDKPVQLEILRHEFGVSSERIRQIEDRAMQKLIAHVNRDNLPESLN